MSNMLDSVFLDIALPIARALPLDADQDCLALLFDQISHGVVVISPHRRILHSNRAARDEMALNGVLYAHHDELRVLSPIDGKALQTALGKASLGIHSLVRLSGSGISLMLSVVPLQHKPDEACERIALFFERTAICDSGMFIFFARNYRLTRTEEQVLTLLCRSMSTPDIAIELKVAVSTVRSHVRSLCIKTGSKGSRELVNRMAMLPPVGAASRVEMH